MLRRYVDRSLDVGSPYGFFFQAEDGIRDLVRSRGLGDVYKRQPVPDRTLTTRTPARTATRFACLFGFGTP